MRAHKRWDNKPSLDNITATVRSAQALLTWLTCCSVDALLTGLTSSYDGRVAINLKVQAPGTAW